MSKSLPALSKTPVIMPFGIVFNYKYECILTQAYKGCNPYLSFSG